MTKNLIKNNQLLGISWMLLHCLVISAIVVLAKLLGQLGYSSVQVVFFHSIVAFILIAPFGLKKYGRNLVKTEKFKLHFLRALLGVLSFIIYFFALKFVELNDARAVALFGPAISFIFGVIFFKEHLNNKKILALVVSLMGGAIIINPASPTFHIALSLVLLAMFMWSITDMIIKKMSKSESTIKQLFFLTGMLSLFSLIPAIFYWKTPDNLYEISLLLLIGFLFLINVYAIFSAIQHADLTTIMPFDFSGMIFTAILTYFIFGEIIKVNTLIGSIVVFVSGLYLIYHERKAGKELAKISAANASRE